MNKPQPAARIKSIRQTVFFIQNAQHGDGLQQRLDVEIESASAITGAAFLSSGPGGERRHPLDPLSPPGGTVSIFLPDFRQPATVEFALLIDGQIIDRFTHHWEPSRHWTVHLVHGSHHDIGYTDLPSSVFRQHDRHLDQAAAYCRQTEDFPPGSRFHYTVEAAWSLLHYLAHSPADKAAQVIDCLRRGRIEVTALFANQTTELCSQEELVRLLYPATRVSRRYGVPIRTAELNDIPGMTWGLASVLAGAGVRYFAPGIPDYFNWGPVSTRYIWDEAAVLARDLPGAFWWQGPDGGRVLFWYTGGAVAWGDVWTLDQFETFASHDLERLQDRGYPYDMLYAKLLSGRGDNSPPDVRFSHIARVWNERWAYPRMRLGTTTDFFERFEAAHGDELPVWRGDIPGTDYPLGAASTARETGINRRTHDRLAAAERFALIAAAAAGYDYPAETLAEACDHMLLYDEHTWGMAHLMGPAQEACWSHKAQYAHRAAALAHDVLVKSANRLADRVHLEAEGYHLVVFNPLARPRSDMVTFPALPASPASRPMSWVDRKDGGPAELVALSAIGRRLVTLPAGLLEAPFELLDLESGRPVPCQVVSLSDPLAARPDAARRYGLGNTDQASADLLNYNASQVKDLVFTAADVPALGFKTFLLRPSEEPGPAPKDPVRVGEYWLENAYYRLEVDPASGALRSLYDKELGRDLVDPAVQAGFGLPLARDPRTGALSYPEAVAVELCEPGPVAASLLVRGALRGCPRWTAEITLYAGIKRVAFAVRMLRDATPLIEHHVAFPLDIPQPAWSFDTPGGAFRPVLDQLPGTNTSVYAVQRWLQAAGPDCTVAWASLDAPMVMLGKLWPSPVSQAHHGVTPPGYRAPFVRSQAEFGPAHIYSVAAANNYRTNFQMSQPADLLLRYALTSAGPQADPHSAVLFSQVFGEDAAQSFFGAAVTGPNDRGTLPSTAGFCRIEPPSVRLLALKTAEDGDGLILRLVETAGRDVTARLVLPFFDIETACLTDLVELEDGESLACDGHSFQVDLPARRIVTVRCRVAQGGLPPVEGWWYD